MFESTCPGCGLQLPKNESAVDKYYYNCSPECAQVFDCVLGVEFSNQLLFQEIHQLTVDAYCVQHAGGRHPAKSVTVHLAGLYAWNQLDIAPSKIAVFHQRLVRNYQKEFNLRGGRESGWPLFEPPKSMVDLGILDVHQTTSPADHADTVRKWCRAIWLSWSDHHDTIGKIFERYAASD